MFPEPLNQKIGKILIWVGDNKLKGSELKKQLIKALEKKILIIDIFNICIIQADFYGHR